MPIILLYMKFRLHNSICSIMFLQNVSFFFSFITLSRVNSCRDIKFCSKYGISAGDAFPGDRLALSICTVGKSCNASYVYVSFSISGEIKVSLNAIGIWVTCSTGGKGSNGELSSCWCSLESQS